MARGPKKHLKRLDAPKAWMLSKLGGTWAPRPSTGPHKLRECIPLTLVLRNRLKYALNRTEVQTIVMRRLVKVDGKVRTDINYPTGFGDIISMDKSDEHFRVLFDEKGRFVLHRITAEEAKFKFCKVLKISTGSKANTGSNPLHTGQQKAVPYVVTHDGRTIRYPDPSINVGDSVKLDLASGRITDVATFEIGNVSMITRGANMGRVGVIGTIEKHPGSFDIVHLKDKRGNTFTTRAGNVFAIGVGNKPDISLPRAKGIKLTIIEQREKSESKKKD
jgi:small subunit ribosomal protein S4e